MRGGFIEKLALYRLSRSLRSFVGRPQSATDSTEETGTTDLQAANDVVDLYFSNLLIVESLAQSFGFSAVFYWQPTVYTKNNLSEWEQQQLDRYNEAGFYQQVHQVLVERMTTRTDDNPFDLSEAFDDEAGTVFIDAVHVSEAGNEKLAELIVQTLPQATARR